MDSEYSLLWHAMRGILNVYRWRTGLGGNRVGGADADADAGIGVGDG